jgi:hypothetical protein
MNQSPFYTLTSRFLCTACLFMIIAIGSSPNQVLAGPYKDSAHGDTTVGVMRSDITAAGYSQGNCAHCHEKHASIEGSEPAPVDSSSPSAFMLFTENFDTSVTGFPYIESDNICFSCHNDAGSIMQVTNYNYSQTFGGFPSPTPIDSILDAFTSQKSKHSEHNLKDVYNFANDTFPYFTEFSNPCTACHNPHLAKRNKTEADNPALTAISRPTDHDNLWGDDANERMSNYTSYRPPYYYNSTTTYEPGDSNLHNGSLMPDYNAFCLDCHQFQVPTSLTASMNPNTPAGYLTAIGWSASGDMHGERPRVNDIDGKPKGFGRVIAPYNVAPVQSNYVLSCVDCHEPHGTVLISVGRPSSYLLRKEVNKNRVEGCGPREENFCETDFCGSCHRFWHCGGPQGCFQCHYHGAENIGCWGPWRRPNF